MRNEQEVRERFLKEFVRELIIHSMRRVRHTRNLEPIIQVSIEKPVVKIEEKKEPLRPVPSMMQSTLAAEPARRLPPPVQQIITRPVLQPMPRPAPQAVPPTAKLAISPPQIPSVNIGPITPQSLRMFGFEKIIQLILDPSVLTIECPGPGKPIIINRAHLTETTNIFLTADEINNIMKNLSDRTRIPLTSGVFKVAFGNFIITAVLSGFVGTRFLMQRRTGIPNMI